MTLTLDVVKSFCTAYEFRLSPETIKRYQKAVTDLLEYSDKPFDEISIRDIRNWLGHLEVNGYQPSTRNIRLFAVKLFYQYCQDERFLPGNPAESILPSKIEEKLPYYLSMEQMSQLRKIVEGHFKERAIIETMYATGVRISELAAMKKEAINWEERSIYIPKGKGKKARIVLFTQECMEHLKAYLQIRRDALPYVFTNRARTKSVQIRTIQHKFESYMKQLGIPLTAHTLRHTFAAHLAIKGMPLVCIQTLLGHENPRNTEMYARLYDHARKQMYDEWM